MWRYSTDSQCQAYKNNEILSLNQVNKLNGRITAFVGVFLAENGDIFRFDNATSTQNFGANACGIVVMPVK